MTRQHRIIPKLTDKDIQRFWSKVIPGTKGNCNSWNGSFRAGYPGFSVDQIAFKASRVAYKIYHDKDPAEMFVLHSCDNKECTLKEHLFLGTHQDNMRDMVAKGRQATGERNGSALHPETKPRGDRHYSRLHPEKLARGERNGSKTHPEKVPRGVRHGSYTKPESTPRGERNKRSKLKEAQVLEIRKEYAEGRISQRKLAVRFKVSQRLILAITKGKVWKHI